MFYAIKRILSFSLSLWEFQCIISCETHNNPRKFWPENILLPVRRGRTDSVLSREQRAR